MPLFHWDATEGANTKYSRVQKIFQHRVIELTFTSLNPACKIARNYTLIKFYLENNWLHRHFLQIVRRSIIAFDRGIAFCVRKDFYHEAAFSSLSRFLLEFYSFRLCNEPKDARMIPPPWYLCIPLRDVISFLRHLFYRIACKRPPPWNRVFNEIWNYLSVIIQTIMGRRVQEVRN